LDSGWIWRRGIKADAESEEQAFGSPTHQRSLILSSSALLRRYVILKVYSHSVHEIAESSETGLN
jgi:hypothetical protein